VQKCDSLSRISASTIIVVPPVELASPSRQVCRVCGVSATALMVNEGKES
jgi:hypothetical protein